MFYKPRLRSQRMTFLTHMCVFICIMAQIVSFMYFRMKSMAQEIEQRDMRIQNLSDMLQVAEYSTGVPYYSCVNQTQFPNETPGWMYGRIREEILRRSVGNRERH